MSAWTDWILFQCSVFNRAKHTNMPNKERKEWLIGIIIFCFILFRTLINYLIRYKFFKIDSIVIYVNVIKSG